MHFSRCMLVATVLAFTIYSVSLATSIPAGYEHRKETPHLLIAWNEGDISEEGLEFALAQGTSNYDAIRGLLGELPLEKIVILLRGPAQEADGTMKQGAIPRVDRSGNIHLYQFGPTFHGYFGPLPHEMVHSFRIHRMPQHDWFFEEGFAEFIALKAGKSIRTFPWFGTPVEIAAAQWLVQDEAIPLRLLRDDHGELNMPCKAQSYTLRSSFFVYLGKAYGDEALLKMAAREKAGAIDDYARFLGKDFELLAAEWREHLLKVWDATDGAAEQARRYREESPLQYMPVCRPGKEFQSAASPANWPSFRGPHASGVADGQNLPDRWDGEGGLNIAWKTRIPGLAHSSPVIWGDRLYVTSAVSSRPDATFRHGLYGDGDASEDRTLHRWMVYALDKKSGEIVWERTAYAGVPKDKRHIKATYANSSPATDGRYIVAMFGSEGLFTLDMEGKLLWQRDLGRLDVGAYDAPDYEWGSASSPIIYEDLVIVQCDTQDDSFVMAFDVATGEIAWKTMRDELPSWGTPTIYPANGRTELITNGSNFIRGYDPRDGQELWRLGGSSKITAPTPIFHDDLIVVANGRSPERPIFAIRAGATGDITLVEGTTSNSSVAWSWVRRGPYMPTPIIYDGRLYVLGNRGNLDCYDLVTGEEIYRQQIKHGGGGFSASPVAADGKLYLPGEDGDIFVVRAGDRFELLATNPIGELLMASPALSGGRLYVRAEKHLFVIGE